MVIQIDGCSSKTNKGAELMLYACLQEISDKYPNAKVYVNSDGFSARQLSEQYNLSVRKNQPYWWRWLVIKTRIAGLLYKLCPSLYWLFTLKVPKKDVDVLLNIGGFQFGDQWNHSKTKNRTWKRYLSKMHAYGTKIIFMPQAFGPFQKKWSKDILRILDAYSDLLIARDSVSMGYLHDSGVSHVETIEFPDFTSSVHAKLQNGNPTKEFVCFIPNSKMITQGIVNEDNYIDAFVSMINHVSTHDKRSFLLNHEGSGDLLLCQKIKAKASADIPVVSKDDALLTKGVIADSYMVVSSRFHGVANALNTAVPCLATSWNHKYQMLFKDYGFDDNILDLSDMTDVFHKLDCYLDAEQNIQVRNKLGDSVLHIRRFNEKMWNHVWNCYENH